ncbi:MAG: hypothetical protein A2076_13890 [Geobacteraceae bacterium GWC2_53_11]|nr:MAG: hypothetical protein A2076_13890 [Geobacteraceae bacterium GWC2_53_11]
MADSPLPIGSRDDVRIEASRCLRMRFCASSCRRCADICPHGAITLDSGFGVDSDRCRGCLLCTTVCRAGALEPNVDFSACLAQLSRVPEPVFGCPRTKGRSHALLPCLGGLSEEHLLTLCHSLTGSLTINLNECADCPNGTTIPRLRHRFTLLAEAGLLEGGCGMTLAEFDAEIRFSDEAVNRRGFFKSLRSALFQSAAVIISGGPEQSERRSDYAGKREPVRRELLNRTAGGLPPEMGKLLRNRYDHRITFSGDCAACHGCVAICPTGALQTDLPDSPPLFDRLVCTGCGLCEEFCLDGAVRVSAAGGNGG